MKFVYHPEELLYFLLTWQLVCFIPVHVAMSNLTTGELSRTLCTNLHSSEHSSHLRVQKALCSL